MAVHCMMKAKKEYFFLSIYYMLITLHKQELVVYKYINSVAYILKSKAVTFHTEIQLRIIIRLVQTRPHVQALTVDWNNFG